MPTQTKSPIRPWLAGAIAAATLAACGGGDDDALPPVAANIAIDPATACSMSGIGATRVTADAPVTILEAATGTTGTGPTDRGYCLVKVKVDPAVNIWVSLPTEDWNGRFRAEGNGVYAGPSQLGVATDSVRQGFVGVKTDTGHEGSPLSGAFGMAQPGQPDVQAQTDFAHRSEHLMAVVGKQLTKAFYGQDPVRSYWYGCSTGGRQGLMMAQRYPQDYDAILAGAPAIHWDRFQAYHIWPQIAMKTETGGPIANPAKRALATSRAVAACDAADGVTDGVIDDPRTCDYNPVEDAAVTRAGCAADDGSCLSPGEATAFQKIWEGARATDGRLLWPGLERGTDLGALAGVQPFAIPIEQARYWVYFDPAWDWSVLNYQNYEAFFNDNIRMVGPMMATDDPDLTAYKQRGGKLILYHGWSDNLIMPQGTTMYYERMRNTVAGADDFSRLYMVPGMGHCSGGPGVNQFGQGASGAVPMEPRTDAFRALMAWSEQGQAPNEIIAARKEGDVVVRTRPLCPYPQVARYKGSGSTDDAANFSCTMP